MTDTIKHFLDKTGTELLYRRVLKNCRNVVHTASEFTENNPILSKGVVGFESDTKKFKVGDGSTLWKALPYFNYSRTELDNLFEAKADKNNTYTIEQVNEALDNIKDLFKEPVVFGGIINEEIIPIQESIDRTDHTQVIFCKPLNSFYYRVEESGTTKYYANWHTKENYMDKYGYPYVGKLYFNVITILFLETAILFTAPPVTFTLSVLPLETLKFFTTAVPVLFLPITNTSLPAPPSMIFPLPPLMLNVSAPLPP